MSAGLSPFDFNDGYAYVGYGYKGAINNNNVNNNNAVRAVNFLIATIKIIHNIYVMLLDIILLIIPERGNKYIPWILVLNTLYIMNFCVSSI